MLFGTSGIRGDADKFFTSQFCFDVGRSFSKFLTNHGQKGAIAIGMDSRNSSERIKYAIIEGLIYEGREIFDEGIAPSPAMNYILIVERDIAGSLMITGSHIRGDFNGVKFFAMSKEILKLHEKEIEEIYGEINGKIDCEKVKSKNNIRLSASDERTISERQRAGLCGPTKSARAGRRIRGRAQPDSRIHKDNRANEYYCEMLYNLAEKPYPKWKIVLDLGNGCQSKIMPELFKKLGTIETIIINDNPKPEYFIARDTEVADTVKEVQEKVIQECANLGVAFDGDGDRAVFIDEDGKFIPGDYTGSLIARYSDTKFVVTPVNASQIVEKIGKLVIRTKVGSPYVVQAMEDEGALFGFEANGGGISREIMLSRDAGSVMIKILNILNRYDKTLKILIEEFPRFFIFRSKIDCPMKIYPVILEKVRDKYKDFKIDDVDGIKIWKDENTWILFRPSSNAPEFRVFTEANSDETATKLGKEGIELVSRIRDETIKKIR